MMSIKTKVRGGFFWKYRLFLYPEFSILHTIKKLTKKMRFALSNPCISSVFVVEYPLINIFD